MAWHTSTRRATLPKDWGTRVRLVHARDHGCCQWPTALPLTDLPHVLAGRMAWPTGDVCGAQGTDVDHKSNRLDHRITSLWLLCPDHHDTKTNAEAQAGRTLTKRTPEQHPGIL